MKLLVKHEKVIFGLLTNKKMMLPSDAIDHDARRQEQSSATEDAFKPGGILLFGYLRKLKVCLDMKYDCDYDSWLQITTL